MGVIKDKRKFKITKVQTNPTNPIGDLKRDNKEFDIKRETIRGSKTKE
ncbi:hypothetical protein [Aquimarina muelleri]|uniref:Uncharacterized protein n=1 Tax=Aquimarina muelleri TaxID=279356 RepID=A0A918JSY8_9FLAO|nr:hypothetical protein [Aquimarina muelleri]MCX2763926.1 hypothetical protein [Aquimarina muelleri]GGX11160.1 hypothetical protein GCM10007384_11190 [Aquimarina muelleri]